MMRLFSFSKHGRLQVTLQHLRRAYQDNHRGSSNDPSQFDYTQQMYAAAAPSQPGNYGYHQPPQYQQQSPYPYPQQSQSPPYYGDYNAAAAQYQQQMYEWQRYQQYMASQQGAADGGIPPQYHQPYISQSSPYYVQSEDYHHSHGFFRTLWRFFRRWVGYALGFYILLTLLDDILEQFGFGITSWKLRRAVEAHELCLLLSSTTCQDPFFKHAVVMLTTWQRDSISGVVLNKPFRDTNGDVMRVRSLPKPLPWLLSSELSNNPVMCGGPVGVSDGVLLFHPLPKVPGAAEVAPGVYCGGDEKYIRKQIIAGACSPGEVLVVVGQSRWSPAQLDGEIDNFGWDSVVTSIYKKSSMFSFKTKPDAPSETGKEVVVAPSSAEQKPLVKEGKEDSKAAWTAAWKKGCGKFISFANRVAVEASVYKAKQSSVEEANKSSSAVGGKPESIDLIVLDNAAEDDAMSLMSSLYNEPDKKEESSFIVSKLVDTTEEEDEEDEEEDDAGKLFGKVFSSSYAKKESAIREGMTPADERARILLEALSMLKRSADVSNLSPPPMPESSIQLAPATAPSLSKRELEIRARIPYLERQRGRPVPLDGFSYHVWDRIRKCVEGSDEDCIEGTSSSIFSRTTPKTDDVSSDGKIM